MQAQAAMQAAAAAKAEDNKPTTFEDILNSLFGGGT